MQGIEFKNKGEIQYWYVPFTIEGDRKKLDTEGDQESGNLDTRDQGDFFNFGAENCSFQFGGYRAITSPSPPHLSRSQFPPRGQLHGLGHAL